MPPSTTWQEEGDAAVLRFGPRSPVQTAHLKRWTVALVLLCTLALSALAAVSGASASAPSRSAGSYRLRHHEVLRHRSVRSRNSRFSAAVSPLVFGIYPGGAAGTVGPSGSTKPEDAALRLAALEQLRPAGRPFILHLYAGYTGPGGYSAAQQVGQEIAAYGRAGFETELVLTYRPADGGSPADVSGFVQFVQASLQSLGSEPGFVSLQVTNEANAGGAPNASDGYYKGAEDALIRGVIAARDVVRSDRVGQVKVGFNWAYQTDNGERAFWSYLGRVGGARFVDAVDWVGVDAYPGTWGPALGAGTMAAATGHFMDGVFRRLRDVYMPLAGIPRRVPLRVTENGYPTGPGRTEAMQVTVMKAAVTAVNRARRAYNITGYSWFDLRDADSQSASFESQYGLMRDDYSPKAAFAAYRELVARFDAP